MEEQIEVTEKVGNIVQGYCDGCTKINDEMNCTVYLNPPAKCRVGCAFSPLVKAKLNPPAEKKRVGQQKQKKKK